MRLCNTPMGLRRLLAATHGLGLWHSTPSSSNDARVARIWEIFSRSGMKVGVYSMLNTTPAAPINGFLRGYGVTPPVEYPRDLEAGLPKLPAVPPVGVHPGPGWVAEMEPYEQALWNRFVTLSLERHPDVLMYYTHFGDGVNHVNWKVETVGDGIFYSGIGRGGYQPGPASIEVNRFLDHIVGDTLRRLPDDALLVIVSDHGFDFRGYEHDNSPPGVLIVRGPGIEDGLIEGGSIYDVAPTLLHLLGLPVADDMVGRVLPVARAGGPLDRKVAHLASYGASEQTKPEGAADAKELRDLESYLRSLGYVVD
jgi:predicted AlkP superfamily phosphohydrolase/phosphomutase